eukprot:CAMPEP_0113567952 /NCGR_PEP_ID=MMETSP0015_2-20120614/23565_1 /TAXON_ID=2838 /ORGANISM="Odontella" /LENGTH=113 /DNA_ID=CAMNT_0000470411 /DNA_START=517 /DNA_END=855 /DNA_ORIENTATION=- /assembly_acc=CAM_ASM_000160
MSAGDADDTVLTEDVRPGATGPTARGGRPISVFAALFGECMCTDTFRVRPSDLRRSCFGGGGAAAAFSRSPFLVLDGIEVLSLGSIEKPGGHSPRERARETAAQLGADATRLV